jgi:MFS family permease
MADQGDAETGPDGQIEIGAISAELESPASVRARENRNIRSLYRHTCWVGVISAVITTFIPIFAVRAGASTFEVGLLTSLPALVAILLSIPAASFAARHRRIVRLVSLTVLGVWVCSVAMTFMPSLLTGGAADYIPEAIIALSALSAVFASISNPAWTAVLADAVSPRRRPVVNGQRWAMLSAVSAATVFIAGWYLDFADFPFGYQSLIVAAALAGLVALYYMEKIEVTTGGHNPAAALPRSPWQTLALVPGMFRGHPAFARYVGTMFVYRMGLGLPAALFPIFWVDHLHASDSWIGIRATAAQGALVVSYALWGRIASRKGYRFVMLCCGLGTATYPALTGLVPAPIWLIPVAILWGFFAGGMDVSLFEGLIDAVPVDQRVLYAAVNTTFANLTILIGPLLGIALVEIIGMRATFGVAGLACLVGSLLYYALTGVRTRSTALELRTGGR